MLCKHQVSGSIPFISTNLGAWESLVIRLLWEQKIVSSNLTGWPNPIRIVAFEDAWSYTAASGF